MKAINYILVAIPVALFPIKIIDILVSYYGYCRYLEILFMIITTLKLGWFLDQMPDLVI